MYVARLPVTIPLLNKVELQTLARQDCIYSELPFVQFGILEVVQIFLESVVKAKCFWDAKRT